MIFASLFLLPHLGVFLIWLSSFQSQFCVYEISGPILLSSHFQLYDLLICNALRLDFHCNCRGKFQNTHQ
ncbi:unnamed protein product [Meloidogyne enterolobii]|uniref:Uncharacterized protein n=1 Tax=Meloidogyne enterolobii TaxID=390850 RepID=A0ACB0ZXA7_MELEN